MSDTTILIVAGPTCSGKTTFADRLGSQYANSDEFVFLSTDSYYRELPDASPERVANYNFDHPDSLDFELLISHLQLLKLGKPIQQPDWDFVTHSRIASRKVEHRETVVLEGIFALYWEPIRELAAASIYVALDEDTCLERRLRRDVIERGRSEVSVRAQFRDTVAPMSKRYVEPTQAFADIVVDGTLPTDEAVQQVFSYLEGLPSSHNARLHR